MKKVRLTALLMIAAMCAVLLTGCGSTVMAKDLVQGNLDELYLGKYDEKYLKMVDINETEAEKTYEDGIETEVEYFLQYFAVDSSVISDSTKEQIAELYRQIYAKSKY